MKRISLKDLTLSPEESKEIAELLTQKRGIQNSYIQYNELINHLITLKSILKYAVKIKKIELEIEKLEEKEINELKDLKEEIFIMTLRNKYLGKSSYDVDEEEKDLIKHAK